MLAEETRQIAAANFFLALNDQVKVNRQFALLRDRFRDPKNVSEDLPLVVGRAPGKDVAVLQDRIERRRFPEFKRIGWLDIVMAIDHYRLATGLMFILRPDHRMPGGRHQFRLQSDPG